MSDVEILRIEAKVNAKLPDDLKAWLLVMGYGDIDEDLSFRFEWFGQVEYGELKGSVMFAQDSLGNFYAYVPESENVVFYSRSAPEYAVLAPTFTSFIEELERRDFKMIEWVESLRARPYSWDG